jgi:hypothetical protein
MPFFRSLSTRLAGALFLAAPCAACIIEPNVIPDAGPVEDAGPVDGGPDAGFIGGTVVATVGTSISLQTVTWAGLDIAGSSSAPIGGATQVLFRGSSDTGGILTFWLINLAPGTTSSQLTSISYQAPSTSPDAWTCNPNPDPIAMCSGAATVTSYDGHTLVGTLTGSFGEASSQTHSSALSLTNGSFNLTLP